MIDSPCLLRLSRRQHCRGREYTVVDDVSEVNYRSAVPDTEISGLPLGVLEASYRCWCLVVCMYLFRCQGLQFGPSDKTFQVRYFTLPRWFISNRAGNRGIEYLLRSIEAIVKGYERLDPRFPTEKGVSAKTQSSRFSNSLILPYPMAGMGVFVLSAQLGPASPTRRHWASHG